MRLTQLLSSQPPVRSVPGARCEARRQLVASGKRLVVVDDDPTGTQTVHDVQVYLSWSVQQLRQAFASGEPVFYVSTNSRAFSRGEAVALSEELSRNLRHAAEAEGAGVLIASRSDSTLRGHFPHEVKALAAGLGHPMDGIVIAPAFFEAGRYTVNDVHWVEQQGVVVSAEKTEFAKDPAFGYRHGNLREWVQEKTGGEVRADGVLAVSLETIRNGGPDAVAEQLIRASDWQPVVANAACYEDLEVFVLGLAKAEAEGKRFIYRCAACFVKARGGLEDRPLLTYEEMRPGTGPSLVVVGSYVEKTSRQLSALLESGGASGLELHVDRLLEDARRDSEVSRGAQWADEQLAAGQCAAVYTSRTRAELQGDAFLAAGKTVMSSLCEVLRRVTVRPGSLVAKGGITSIEVARSALGVNQARVLGQILDGIPVWGLGPESRWPGMPYVVFPGNVGDEQALRRVVERLQGAAR